MPEWGTESCVYVHFFQHREILSNDVPGNGVVFYVGKKCAISRTPFLMEAQTC